MAPQRHLFTSESVSMGHPDKVADQISDAILDAYLAQDPGSRVACETLVTTGMAVIAGEVTSRATVPISDIVRQTVREIGYIDARLGFDADACAVLVCLGRQSPDIAQGVDEGKGLDLEQGAGDQGLMFGFACDETPELMPLPISLAHKLMEEQARLRTTKEVAFLRPDAKSQVTVEYDGDTPVRVDTVLVSTQHDEKVSHAQVSATVIEQLIQRVIPARFLDKRTRFIVNPTGRFVIGGPHGDCGLTGRKIIVDTYGGRGRHGGGAFSGKDPSKVDRSASYMARYVAKNVVKAGLARRCEVQVSYAIGIAAPVSVMVDTQGTGEIPDAEIGEIVRREFDLRPKAIIQQLDLLRPIYRETARHGHFGRELASFTWERTDMAPRLRPKRAAAIPR